MEQKPKPMPESKALSKMANLCARREYCVFDIETKLKRYNLEEETIQNIIAHLVKEKYIDEERYTRGFIKDKIRFNKWGKTKIEFALRQKRVPEEIVATVFSEYTNEELNHPLQGLLQAKWKTIKGKSDYDKRNKLIRFGLSRGYDMNNILKRINNIQ